MLYYKNVWLKQSGSKWNTNTKKCYFSIVRLILCYKNVCSNESSMLKLKSQLLKIDRNIDYVHSSISKHEFLQKLKVNCNET